MSGYFETGHVKNVANFLKYNQFLATLGIKYNPSNVTITLPSLTTTQSLSSTKQSTVNANDKAWKDATNDRETPFDELPSFSTQLLSALKSSNATQLTIDDFAFLVGKMQGYTNAKTTQNDNSKIAIDPSY